VLSQNYLKSDGTIAMVYSYVDAKFKIYSLANNTFSFLQTIAMVSPIPRMDPLKGNYLVVGNLSSLVRYEYNSGTGLYVLNYTYPFTTVNGMVFSFSEDGIMMTQVTIGVLANDFTMIIHELNIITGVFTDTTLTLGFPAGTNKYVRDASMILKNGIYILLVVMQDSSTHYLKYYHITTGSTFTEQQSVVTGSVFLSY
jgi:hypothetical protein